MRCRTRCLALVRRVGALRAAEAVTSWLFVAIRHACLRRVPEVVLVPVEVAGDLAEPTRRAGWSTGWWSPRRWPHCRRRTVR